MARVISAKRPVPIAERPYTILYVVGAGHSGSTLLNLLLNAHSEVVGLCELQFLDKYLQFPKDSELYPLRHQFWRDVADCWQRKTNIGFGEISIGTPSRKQIRSWSRGVVEQYRQHNSALFDCIAEVSGRRILVDTSKNLIRLRLLAEAGLPLKVVHLVRDGRGVVNSYRNKYGNFGVGLHRWFGRALIGPLARKSLSDIHWTIVKYEDLAGAPESTLKQLCEFAEMQYEPGMLRYWESDDHSIGGNRMRRAKSEIKLDERWCRELTTFQQILFAIMASWLNRFYGYPVIGKYHPPV